MGKNGIYTGKRANVDKETSYPFVDYTASNTPYFMGFYDSFSITHGVKSLYGALNGLKTGESS